MKFVAILLLLVASTCAIEFEEEKRDLIDVFLNTFGLGNVWDTIQQVGANLLGQFTASLTQLLFAGQQAWNSAKPIFTQLVADLQAHASDAVPIVTSAIAQLAGVLTNSGKRDIVDFLLNQFGLAQVWSTIQQLGGNFVAQITSSLTQLLFAGQNVWAQAQTIFNQLVADLQAHAGDALPYVQQAVAALSQVLANNGGKRDVVDFFVNTFGLGGVWGTISQVGSNLLAQVKAILTQLLFAGQQAWNNAKPIFSQLVSDLTAHASDAVPLVTNAVAQLTQILSNSGKRDVVEFLLNSFNVGQIWTTVQQLGGNLVGQFQATLTQLLFAGQNVWAQAQTIFNQLVADLQAHAGDALPYVQQAITALSQAIANQSGKRDIVDFLLNQFGLSQVWSTIQQLGGNFVAQITSSLTQLVFAGQGVWAQAQVIFNQLVADLQAHAGDALPYVQQAVAALAQALGNNGKRGIVEFLSGTFNLGNVWSTIQNAGSNLAAQFQAVLTQLVFAGQQTIDRVKPIFAQLVSNLQSHTGDAVQIINQAISQVNQVLASQVSGKRDILDFILNSFGLGQIWTTVQQLGSQLAQTFQTELTQLLFAGQAAWDAAGVIFSQLGQDLAAHAGDALPYVQAAIASLAQVLANPPSGKRDIVDLLLNTFGLGNIWSQVLEAGNNVVGQFQAALTQLLFAGSNAWAQAQQVFNQLVSDLINHTGDATNIVAGAVSQLNQVLAAGKY